MERSWGLALSTDRLSAWAEDADIYFVLGDDMVQIGVCARIAFRSVMFSTF